MAAARKAQLAADADLARAMAEDEAGVALANGKRNMSGMGLTDKGDVVNDMQAEVLANAAARRASENQGQDRILSQEGHAGSGSKNAKKRGRRTRSVRIG